MVKSPDAFRSIGEVSRLVGVAPHVLRYWEGQFTQLSPVKRADGRRYYRPDDVRLVAGLCQVMREEGMSIRGAKRLITADRGAGLREIGAARLGEGADPGAETTRPRVAAVRLARPNETAATGLKADDKISAEAHMPNNPSKDSGKNLIKDSVAAPPPRRKPRPAATPESLPLFPGIDQTPPAEWLGRLVNVTAALRQAMIKGSALPATAEHLRDHLANRTLAMR